MRAVIATLESVCQVLSWIAIGIISLLAFPMLYDVFLRASGHPTIWAFEITTYLLIAGTFLANAHALKEGNHFRVTFILKVFPRAAWIFDLFAILVTMMFGLLLTVAGGMLAYKSYSIGLESPTLLRISLYLPQLALPLGGLSLTAQALIILLSGRYPELHGVAVEE